MKTLISSLAYALILMLLIFPGTGCKNRNALLVLGSDGSCDYQLILPEQADDVLIKTADLIKEAFAAHDLELGVVPENKDDASKPGIYLGDTRFADSHGIEPSLFEDWGYLFMVVGKDLIITGSNFEERLGVVKGVCDFLREYAGTRFLYPGRTGIEYLDMKDISIPADLDIARTPMLKFNFSGNMYPEEWLYNIANNHYHDNIEFGGHMWHKAVPYKQYFRDHPEYFALVDNKRLDRGDKSQYCISSQRVKKLIIEYLIQLYDQGDEIVYLAQPDGFTPCQCKECFKLYGTGDDWDDKVWNFHREIAEAVQKERPDAKVLMLSYQATTHPPKTFDKFPGNTMVLLSHTYKEALDEWSRFEVPAGYAAYLQNFGSYFPTNYLPNRSPKWLEAQAKRFYEMNIIGLLPDAAIYCYGLEGPLYYVWGRMFDDPAGNNADELLDEFYTAAFAEAAGPMRDFYTQLHQDIDLYSEWLGSRTATHFRMPINGRKPGGIDDPLDWVRVPTAQFGSRGMVMGIKDPGQVLSIIYTPGVVAGLERKLEKAEALATGDKVKLRLSLVRMEVNYLKQIATIIDLYNAYKIEPDDVSLKRLLDEIDSWNALLDTFYDPEGNMKPLSGWPELRPFRNAGRKGLGLINSRFWINVEKQNNPFSWDTGAIRDSLLIK